MPCELRANCRPGGTLMSSVPQRASSANQVLELWQADSAAFPGRWCPGVRMSACCCTVGPTDQGVQEELLFQSAVNLT